MHLICAEIVDVIGPVTSDRSSVGDGGGLGSPKELTVESDRDDICAEGSSVRAWGVDIEDELIRDTGEREFPGMPGMGGAL